MRILRHSRSLDAQDVLMQTVATYESVFSLPRAIALWGLRTRAIPAGVTVLRETEQVKRVIVIGKYPFSIEVLFPYNKKCSKLIFFSEQSRHLETPAGGRLRTVTSCDQRRH